MFNICVIMMEDETEEKILQLHKELLNISDNVTDTDISRIMYKVLLFAMNCKRMDEDTLNNYSWKYYEENKDYFMQFIP